MKIYIYNLEELKNIMSFFESVPPEMDLYDLFTEQLRSKYEVVDVIEDADVAFIPIDYVKLIYGKVKDNQWFALHKILKKCDKYSHLVPDEQPRTFGVGYKENYIKFFWYNFVKDKLKLDTKIPHFILYNYVLFEISFESVDKEVYILSYEDEVSFFTTTETFKIGTYDRMIVIPYVLNKNVSYSLPKMETTINSKSKIYDLTFIGALDSNERPVIKLVRNFIKLLKSKVYFSDMENISDDLMKTKYLFVLRGDTPTRISFYQCIVYGAVPILFEKELKLYQKVFTDDIDLRESCMVLPDKNGMSDINYSKLVDDAIHEELSNPNNYTNKIKNHKLLFDQINYFGNDGLPLENSIKKIISK